MTNQSKIALGAIVVVLVVAAGMYISFGRSSSQQPAAMPYTQSTTPSSTQPATSQSQSGTTQNSSAGSSATVSGSTDADLNQSLNSIDSQMSGLNSDSANVDAGLNDKPIAQPQ